MGLDLVLYKRTKPIAEMSVEEELDSELAYGRKTWAIAEFLYSRSEDVNGGEYLYKVPEWTWDRFITALDKLNDADFRKKVEDYVEYCRGAEPDEEYEFKAHRELEDWLDHALDNSANYQLGLDWELAAVLRWFDADTAVREVYKENPEGVYLLVSY